MHCLANCRERMPVAIEKMPEILHIDHTAGNTAEQVAAGGNKCKRSQVPVVQQGYCPGNLATFQESIIKRCSPGATDGHSDSHHCMITCEISSAELLSSSTISLILRQTSGSGPPAQYWQQVPWLFQIHMIYRFVRNKESADPFAGPYELGTFFSL